MRKPLIEVLQDIHYLQASAKIIVDSLRNGCDVAQLPNGDIITTQLLVVNKGYRWDPNKKAIAKQERANFSGPGSLPQE